MKNPPEDMTDPSPARNGAFWRGLRVPWRRLFRDEGFRTRMHFFRQVFLFKGLGEHALALLANSMMEKSYGPGEILFEEGDVGRACFIVAEGRVEIFRARKPAGKPELLAIMGPG